MATAGWWLFGFAVIVVGLFGVLMLDMSLVPTVAVGIVSVLMSLAALAWLREEM